MISPKIDTFIKKINLVSFRESKSKLGKRGTISCGETKTIWKNGFYKFVDLKIIV